MLKNTSKKSLTMLRVLLILLIYIIVMNIFIAVYIGYTNKNLSLNFTEIKTYMLENVVASTPDLQLGLQAEDFIQQTSYTCGPAALRYLLYSRFKIDISEERIAELTSTNPKGTSLAGMVSALENLGLQGRGSQVNYPMLEKVAKPVIAFINDYHYIVILETKGQYIYAFDPNPGYGHMKAPKESFLKVWDGIILQVMTQNLVSDEGGD